MTMRAFVVHAPGGPEALRLETRPVPSVGHGQVRIRVRAFGINRAEIMTRKGLSPAVAFPRILGIEAVGTVDACPSGRLDRDDIVATAMGGMGRTFDGSYAEYLVVPEEQVQTVHTALPWSTLAALPEMVQTAYGALFRGLRILPGATILIRGGTSSVGLMAGTLARRHGCTVISTTRNKTRSDFLKQYGARHVVIDEGNVADDVRSLIPDGVDNVLDLVGTPTMADNFDALKPSGLLCLAGILSGQWALRDFSPMFDIPTDKRLTAYVGDAQDFMRTPLQEIVNLIERGLLDIPIGETVPFENTPDAHRAIEANTTPGKWVVWL
ncbi:zinc-binding dehydrogenase [Kaustia mangrovi]|uniref:Zinc-binding dehydrogenase n=2 Tax=Kaustia mangrovi TaxID=2593653 RepID=A0A7S8HE25_9HYPH|nr:zinc-binding dehydrogenase [Kaustia mangrovi]